MGNPHADPPPAAPGPGEDPFLWLEDVTGDRALAWVRERNLETAGPSRTGRPSGNWKPTS